MYGKSLERTGGVWVAKPFTNWKKAVEKMKAHEQSVGHGMAKESALAAEGAVLEGSVVQKLQNVEKQDKLKNRAAIKSLIRCTHFLARQHIPHTTNFEKLVDLVVSCGGESLKRFLESTGKNAVYTSHVAVVEFVEALGTWVEESICITQGTIASWQMSALIVEELSLFCRWEEDGVPKEHFLEVIHT